jgi:hypothetical protein
MVIPCACGLFLYALRNTNTLLEKWLVSMVTYRKHQTLTQWFDSPSKYSLTVRRKGDLIPNDHIFAWGYK